MIAAVPYHEVLLAVVGIACAMGARGYTRHEPEPVTEPAPPPQAGELPTYSYYEALRHILNSTLATRHTEADPQSFLSAYEVARNHGFSGDMIDWRESIEKKRVRRAAGQHALAYMEQKERK